MSRPTISYSVSRRFFIFPVLDTRPATQEGKKPHYGKNATASSEERGLLGDICSWCELGKELPHGGEIRVG